MTYLMQIQDFIQTYVMALSAILNVEVTVIDNELIRVGASDPNTKSGEKIAHESLFQRVMETGQPGVIEDVRKEFSCNFCEKYKTCKELANIAYPIFLEDQVIGTIGIIAFYERQRQSLLKNREKLEEFLKYMSALIESKIETTQNNNYLEQQIRGVITDEKLSLGRNRIVGVHSQFLELITRAEHAAKSDSAVLLTGESGTGKKLLAKRIHLTGNRSGHRMITLNCASVSETLIDSELFGYESGAFTGANRCGKAGKLELAAHSTLLLEEVSELPLFIQGKLLQVLQTKELYRLGGTSPVSVDIRLISTSVANLRELVSQGRFRRDLYNRLSTVTIQVMPLRERREDIPQLFDYFMDIYGRTFKRGKMKIVPEAKKLLYQYDWPGNVRELKNIAEYLVNVADKDTVEVQNLPTVFLTDGKIPGGGLKDILEQYERIVIKSHLRSAKTIEDRDALAEELKISRATLYRKLAKYGLE